MNELKQYRVLPGVVLKVLENGQERAATEGDIVSLPDDVVSVHTGRIELVRPERRQPEPLPADDSSVA